MTHTPACRQAGLESWHRNYYCKSLMQEPETRTKHSEVKFWSVLRSDDTILRGRGGFKRVGAGPRNSEAPTLYVNMKDNRQKLLLDVCCGVCFSGVYEQLKKEFDVTAYWHNANIFPKEEYFKRLSSFENAFKGFKMIIDNEDWSINHEYWLRFIKEKRYAKEPEGGKRCLLCYNYRLEKVASYAKDNGFDLFASTLTISPHKNAEVINKIGLSAQNKVLRLPPIAQDGRPRFLPANFKKKDGFKIANKISKKKNIYRQNYCGCEFSIR